MADEYSVDLLLSPAFLVAGTPDHTVLSDHTLVVRGGSIVDVLPTATAVRSYRAASTVELPHAVVIPGFVDAHAVTPLSLAAAAPAANTLAAPSAYTPALSCAWAHTGRALGAANALRAGTTTLADSCLYASSLADTARALGIRTVAGHLLLPYASPAATLPRDAVKRVLDECAAADLAGADEGTIAAHMFVVENPAQHPDDTLEHVAALARRTRARVKLVLSPGASLRRLAALGLVTPATIVVHPAALSGDELALAAEAGAQLVYAPSHDLAEQAPALALAPLLDAGVAVAVASCGGERAFAPDVLAALRLALVVQNSNPDASRLLTPHDMLELGTARAAAVLGLDDRLGTLTRGMQADCVAFSLTDPALALFPDPLDALFHGPPGAAPIVGVWVSGQERSATALDAAATAAAHARLWQREGWILTGQPDDGPPDSSSSSTHDPIVVVPSSLPGRPPLRIDYDAILASYLDPAP